MIVYWLIAIASYGVDYYRRYQGERSRTAQLEKELAQAQLQALKMQLQPHFLFNTLHSLSSLVLHDSEAAVRMVTRLGDFLRLTLDGSNSQITSLSQELRLVRAYLEIERIRFSDRLEVIEAIDPTANQAPVPNLILQPLVENAIRHGISAHVGAGRLRIAARRDGRQLWLEVEDDGPGTSATSADGSDGLGLANTRRRLQKLYGREQSLQITQGPWGGTLVILTIPFWLPA